MQKKHSVLIVLSLATLTLVAVFVRQNGMSSLFGMRMVNDGVYSEQIMPMAGGFGEMGLDYPGVISSAVSNKMAIEPMIGSMPPYYDDYALDVEERSYEKSSYHSVVVDDVSKYLRGIKEYFSSINGVILSSNMSSSGKYESGSVYVKVPAEKFDEVSVRVTEDVEKVVDENISAYDVTGQVVRTDENLQSLQDQKALKEAALLDAQTEVEKKRIEIEISRLERQIENAQKAQESVTARIEYASVSITAAQSERYFNPQANGDIRYEFERAWESLKSFFKVAALFGVWILVYSVVWAPIVWILNKIVKKFKK